MWPNQQSNRPLLTRGTLSRLSFPFGWLFLPVDLIGRPFSQRTREHFLPLLTSTTWWSQTQLALRKVFQIDPDFQERMFARQMAVMKGQAWNVVETLKTADHGPLELTRRAKVCVWDDLVDVPVAVPMRATSAEMRRRTAGDMARSGGAGGIEEEMDIGAGAGGDANGGRATTGVTAVTTTGPAALTRHSTSDLLGLSSPSTELPNPGRFELASPPPDDPEARPVSSPPPLPSGTTSGGSTSADSEAKGASAGQRTDAATSSLRGGRPTVARTSRSGPPRSLNLYSPERQRQGRQHKRRFSFTTTAARRESISIAAQLYGRGGDAARHSFDDYYGYRYADDDDDDDDDAALEGDLGYAAAQDMEGNRRKVIVERLEAVKSKNPVFTWC